MVGRRLYFHAGDAGLHRRLVYVTIVGQVPHLLASRVSQATFSPKLDVLRHLADAALAPVLTGLLSLAAMQPIATLRASRPAALVVMVVATAAIGLLAERRPAFMSRGTFRRGTPHLVLPNFRPWQYSELAPAALAICLSVTRVARCGKGRGHRERWRHRSKSRIGRAWAGHILSGLFGGFLVVGSLPNLGGTGRGRSKPSSPISSLPFFVF